MTEQETGFRIGADGRTYFTGIGRRTKKTRLGGGIRRLSGVTRKAVKFTGRGAFRVGRATAHRTSRYATGLSPAEYQEYRRLKGEEARGTFTRDETYLLEVRRLNELEKRYLATAGKRKEELRGIYRRLKQGPPNRRLRA